MFARLGKILLVLALVAGLGAHWVLLQTVAWTTMLAGNLQTSSFHEALAKTFDGRHPCRLCQAIAAGKHSEKKSDVSFKLHKLDFPPLQECIVLIAPKPFRLSSPADAPAELRAQPPPTPPPRAGIV